MFHLFFLRVVFDTCTYRYFVFIVYICSIAQVWDFPGQIDFFDPGNLLLIFTQHSFVFINAIINFSTPIIQIDINLPYHFQNHAAFDSEMIFKGCGALVFVIDARDDYIEALTKLNKTVLKAHAVNKQIKFEVFIHKVDGISDDLKMETQRDIHQRATDDLADAGYDRIHLSFHLTSIYDHSIFEAFSKVVQKLIPQLPKLENLLNIFITVSVHPSHPPLDKLCS